MNRLLTWLLMAALAALVAAGCRAGAPREELTVFAAASLADLLTALGERFAAENGTRVIFNFAGSNTLSRQIEAGAPADLFLSADRTQLERLSERGRVRSGEIEAWLGNRLVVVVPAGAGAISGSAAELGSAAALAAYDRIAVADPDGVPAGVYARRWLERQGQWRVLAPRLVPAADVRAALAAVASGGLPAGIVYASDATSEPRVRIVYRVGDGEGPAILYFGAPVLGGRPHPETAALWRALRVAGGAVDWAERFGFRPLVEGGD